MTNDEQFLQRSDSALARSIRGGLALAVAATILAIFPYTAQPAFEIKNLLIAVFAAGLTLLTIGGFWWRGEPLRRPGPLLIVLAGWTVWLAVTGFVSEHPGHSFGRLLERLALLGLAFVAAQVITEADQIRRLLAVTCWAALIATIYAFFQRAGIDPFPWDARADEAYTGLPATYGNANFAAHALALAIVAALILCKGRAALVYAPMAVLFLVHLAFTRQRGAWIALTLALVLYLLTLLARRRNLPAKRAAIFVLASTAIVGAAAAIAVVGAHWLQTGRPLPVDGSVLLRYNAYLGASEMIVDAPVFGYGLGNYVIENPPYWTPYEQRWFSERLRLNNHVHNDLLESGVSAGVLGSAFHIAVFVLAIAAMVAWAIRKRGLERRLGLGMAVWFCAFAVDGFFGFNLRVPATATLLYVYLGAVDGATAPLTPVRRTWAIWSYRAVGVALSLLVMGAAVRTFTAAINYKRGIDTFAVGNLAKADEFLSRGEKQAPRDWLFPWQRGLIHLDAGNYADAVMHFQRTLALHPNYVVAQAALGQAYLGFASNTRSQDLAKGSTTDDVLRAARAAANDALKLAPDFPVAHEVLARAALTEAREAAEAGASSEELQPYFEEAEKHARAALFYAPRTDGGTRLLLFQALAGQNELEDAMDAIKAAAKAEPENADLWAIFYTFATQQDQKSAFRAAAETAYATLVKAERPIPASLQALGQIEQGQAASYLGALRALADAADTVPPEQRTAGRLRELAWGVEEILNRAGETESFDAETLARMRFQAARLFIAFEATQQATSLLMPSVEHLPLDEQTYATVYLADKLSEDGQTEAALLLIRDLLPRAADNVNLRLIHARVLARAGKIAEARAEYQTILRTFQLNPETTDMIKGEYYALQ